MNYAEFIDRASNLCVVDAADADFLAIMPACITYAEDRIFHDIDMVATETISATHIIPALTRTIPLPESEFLTVERVSIIVPPLTWLPDAGRRKPLTPTSRDYLDLVYGSVSGAGEPAYFAIRGGGADRTIIVGPWAGSSYGTEITGTQRAAPLSATNTETAVTRELPALFLAAAMVFLTGWQKNYGSQADDPKMAGSWEGQYQGLLAGARGDESRKRLEGAGWTSRTPAPAASIPRA